FSKTFTSTVHGFVKQEYRRRRSHAYDPDYKQHFIDLAAKMPQFGRREPPSPGRILPRIIPLIMLTVGMIFFYASGGAGFLASSILATRQREDREDPIPEGLFDELNLGPWARDHIVAYEKVTDVVFEGRHGRFSSAAEGLHTPFRLNFLPYMARRIAELKEGMTANEDYYYVASLIPGDPSEASKAYAAFLEADRRARSNLSRESISKEEALLIMHSMTRMMRSYGAFVSDDEWIAQVAAKYDSIMAELGRQLQSGSIDQQWFTGLNPGRKVEDVTGPGDFVNFLHQQGIAEYMERERSSEGMPGLLQAAIYCPSENRLLTLGELRVFGVDEDTARRGLPPSLNLIFQRLLYQAEDFPNNRSRGARGAQMALPSRLVDGMIGPASVMTVQGNTVMIQLGGGVHATKLTIDLTEPENGGYVEFEMSEVGKLPTRGEIDDAIKGRGGLHVSSVGFGRGNKLRQELVEMVLKRAGFETNIQGEGENSVLSARLNSRAFSKKGSADIDDLIEATSVAFSLVFRMRSVDLVLRSISNEYTDKSVREMAMPVWVEHLEGGRFNFDYLYGDREGGCNSYKLRMVDGGCWQGVYEQDQFMYCIAQSIDRYGDQMRPALNAELGRLGHAPIPADKPVSQALRDLHFEGNVSQEAIAQLLDSHGGSIRAALTPALKRHNFMDEVLTRPLSTLVKNLYFNQIRYINLIAQEIDNHTDSIRAALNLELERSGFAQIPAEGSISGTMSELYHRNARCRDLVMAAITAHYETISAALNPELEKIGFDRIASSPRSLESFLAHRFFECTRFEDLMAMAIDAHGNSLRDTLNPQLRQLGIDQIPVDAPVSHALSVLYVAYPEHRSLISEAIERHKTLIHETLNSQMQAFGFTPIGVTEPIAQMAEERFFIVSEYRDLITILMDEYEGSMRDELNRELERLGFVQIPQEVPISQTAIDRYFNGPIEEALDLGQLVMRDNRPEINYRDVNPVRFLGDNLHKTQISVEAVKTASLMQRCAGQMAFDDIGAIGGYLVRQAVITRPEGHITILIFWNPRTLNIDLAYAVRGDGLRIPMNRGQLSPERISLSFDELSDELIRLQYLDRETAEAARLDKTETHSLILDLKRRDSSIGVMLHRPLPAHIFLGEPAPAYLHLAGLGVVTGRASFKVAVEADTGTTNIPRVYVGDLTPDEASSLSPDIIGNLCTIGNSTDHPTIVLAGKKIPKLWVSAGRIDQDSGGRFLKARIAQREFRTIRSELGFDVSYIEEEGALSSLEIREGDLVTIDPSHQTVYVLGRDALMMRAYEA
ncbi:MAG: hypothetical protein HQ593_06525, partial [Candidatus Omnitrophica bacterium]|nr:hypothetical protein [Candidatus Omnitrophota bacterium]